MKGALDDKINGVFSLWLVKYCWRGVLGGEDLEIGSGYHELGLRGGQESRVGFM